MALDIWDETLETTVNHPIVQQFYCRIPTSFVYLVRNFIWCRTLSNSFVYLLLNFWWFRIFYTKLMFVSCTIETFCIFAMKLPMIPYIAYKTFTGFVDLPVVIKVFYEAHDNYVNYQMASNVPYETFNTSANHTTNVRRFVSLDSRLYQAEVFFACVKIKQQLHFWLIEYFPFLFLSNESLSTCD